MRCRRAALAALVMLSACGRIGFDPLATTSSSDATGGSDVVVVPGAPFTLTIPGTGMIRGIAEVPEGGIVVVGTASGLTQLGTIPLTGDGSPDILIASIDPFGNVRWAKLLGGAGNDFASGVTAAADGTLFITGQIGGNVDLGGGPLVSNADDAFVASFTPNGTHLWSFRFGGGSTGSTTDAGTGVALAPDGDLVVSGTVSGIVDFGDGSMTTASGATYDGFVARYAPTGFPLRWARRFGSTAENAASAVAAAPDGNIYAAGYYSGTPDVLGSGALPNFGADDALVLALTSAGAFRWVRTFGASNNDRLYGIGITGSTVIAGGYYWDTPNVAGIPTSRGASDGIVVAYDTSGTPAWSTSYGDTGCDFLTGMHTTSSGVIAVGLFAGTVDFSGQVRTATGTDSLVFGPVANGVTWSSSFDLSGDDMAIDAAGAPSTGLYVAGAANNAFNSGCYPQSATGFIRRL